MTKKQIEILDGIKDGKRCSAAIVRKGLTVCRIDSGIFVQRVAKPVGFAWSVVCRKDLASGLFMLPTDKLGLSFTTRSTKANAEKYDLHFRIDL